MYIYMCVCEGQRDEENKIMVMKNVASTPRGQKIARDDWMDII